MRGPKVTVERGFVVKSFDGESLWGEIALDNDANGSKYDGHKHTVSFHSTQFRSGRPTRHPIVGDRVEIIRNHEGKLISVRKTD